MRRLAMLLLPRLLRELAPRLYEAIVSGELLDALMRLGKTAKRDDLVADVERIRGLLRTKTP